jgi:pimeloyl-ACP methyl ester carboxylesterase
VTPSTVAASTKEFGGYYRALGLTSFAIVGFTFGAMIAQELAPEIPDVAR